MSVTSYFGRTNPGLCMPKFADENGITFHGDVLDGHLSTTEAFQIQDYSVRQQPAVSTPTWVPGLLENPKYCGPHNLELPL